MDYFVGKGLTDALTAVGTAQITRLRLFKEMGATAQIVSFGYSRRLHTVAAKFGVDDVNLCNMFDYLQEAQTVTPRLVHPRELQPEGTTAMDGGQNGGVQAVNFMQGTVLRLQVRYLKASDAVQSVLMPGPDGKPTYTDSYDTRGFLSRRSHLDTAGNLTRDEFFTPAGKVVMESVYDHQKHSGVAEITLADGTMFTSVRELQHHFLQMLDAAEPSRFFFDADADYAMLTALSLQGHKFMVLHQDHHADPKKQRIEDATAWQKLGLQGKVKLVTTPYASELRHPGNLDAVIVSTRAQREALIAEYPDLPPVVVAAAGVSVPLPERVDWAKRDANLILAVSRIAPDQGLMGLIEAFIVVKTHYPALHLHLYAENTEPAAQRILERLHKRVVDAGLQDDVTFMVYPGETGIAYDEAGLFIAPNGPSAFNMPMQSALAHGVPVISYDVDYGPKDMIVDNRNGLLVPVGDKQALAQMMAALLHDPTQQERLSEGAYAMREAYGPESVWAHYQTLPQVDDWKVR